jgi:hypothetical protein
MPSFPPFPQPPPFRPPPQPPPFKPAIDGSMQPANSVNSYNAHVSAHRAAADAFQRQFEQDKRTREATQTLLDRQSRAMRQPREQNCAPQPSYDGRGSGGASFVWILVLLGLGAFLIWAYAGGDSERRDGSPSAARAFRGIPERAAVLVRGDHGPDRGEESVAQPGRLAANPANPATVRRAQLPGLRAGNALNRYGATPGPRL